MANIVQRSPLVGNFVRLSPFMNTENWFNEFGVRPFFSEADSALQIKIDVTEIVIS